MATFTFNIAKGRVVEFYNRVKGNDPANSGLVLVPLSATDVQATLEDLDTLAAVLAGAPNEAGGSWGRKVLTDADLAAAAVDDANNRFPVAVPQVTWVAPTGGQDVVGLLVCYDPDTTAGVDADIISLTHHDFAVTADGNDVILNAGDFFRGT